MRPCATRCVDGTMAMLPPQFLLLSELAALSPNSLESLATAPRAHLSAIEPHFVGMVPGTQAGLAADVKCIALTLPGDFQHNEFPGPPEQLNRVICPLPIGTRSRFVNRSIAAVAQL